MQNIKQLFEVLLKLTRINISLFSALSASLGFILAGGILSFSIIFPATGIFLLACGSSALNQYQERKTDSLMNRTKKRPIPSGKIKPETALVFSVLLILCGMAIVSFSTPYPAIILSLFAVAWYNGVYTFLKRKSAFAAVPGALIGSIPPAIGWVSGGGNLFNTEIAAVAFFFFIWQVPHFWLVILNHGREYEEAGLPSLTQLFSGEQLKRITFIWTAAAAVTCLLLPLFGPTKSILVTLLLPASAVWLILSGLKLFKASGEISLFRATFRKTNIYALVIIFLLSIDRLCNG